MSDMRKRYKVVIQDDASQMLYAHVRFLANVSIPAARKLKVTLSDAIDSLKNMPYRCPVFRTHGTANTYRKLVAGRYQIIFSVSDEENTVFVCYILDSRQDNDI
jgi:plasmid stabilization system protein ParE